SVFSFFFPYISSVLGQCVFITCQLYEYHFIKEQMSWDEARAYCREKYTDLAKVFDLTDMRRLQDSAQNQTEAWIGLYSEPGRDNRRWHWSLPGEEYTENKTCWGAGEPNDGAYPENCVRTRDKWADYPCTSTYQFIYSWRWSDGSNFSFRYWDMDSFNDGLNNRTCATTLLERSGRWSSAGCDQRKPFFCYDDKLILIRENKTWEEALNYCRQKHDDLVSISNPHQQRWVQERAKNASTPFVWLGLRYGCAARLWLWVTDYVVCYERWASGGKTEDCDMSAAMTTGGQHEWVSQRDNETFNFICIKH
uniref:C-type lectin domain-containing protein n=1 Tax=Oreochromis aureus TaxID=47969 RepID=A0A668SRU3_OREAU